MKDPQLRARCLDTDNDKKTPATARIGTRSVTVAMTVVMLVVVASPIVAQEGRTYAVKFKDTDGDKDNGCMTFSAVAPGEMIITEEDDEVEAFVWGHTQLNKSKKNFIGGNKFTAFAGKTKGGGRRIVGDAIEGALLISFKGREDPDCVEKLRLRLKRR